MWSSGLKHIRVHHDESRSEPREAYQQRQQRKLPNPSLIRFAISTLVSYAAARFFADFLHFRLYVTHERIHLHHFVLGLFLMPISWLAFEDNRNTDAELLAGAVVGLFLSELKQLILERVGPVEICHYPLRHQPLEKITPLQRIVNQLSTSRR